MKKLYLLIFALISISAVSAAKNRNYIPISQEAIYDTQRLQDFAQLGTDYVVQQGIFSDSADALPNGKYILDEVESLYKRYENGVFYYKYTVLIQSQSAPLQIRATFVISYRFYNGATNVVDYEYAIVKDDPNGPIIADLPLHISLKALDDGSGLKCFLGQGVRDMTKDLIQQGAIPDDNYRVGETFAVKDTGFSYPYGYVFVTSFVNSQGYTRRAEVTVFATDNNDPDNEDASFPPNYIVYEN